MSHDDPINSDTLLDKVETFARSGDISSAEDIENVFCAYRLLGRLIIDEFGVHANQIVDLRHVHWCPVDGVSRKGFVFLDLSSMDTERHAVLWDGENDSILHESVDFVPFSTLSNCITRKVVYKDVDFLVILKPDLRRSMRTILDRCIASGAKTVTWTDLQH